MNNNTSAKKEEKSSGNWWISGLFTIIGTVIGGLITVWSSYLTQSSSADFEREKTRLTSLQSVFNDCNDYLRWFLDVENLVKRDSFPYPSRPWMLTQKIQTNVSLFEPDASIEAENFAKYASTFNKFFDKNVAGRSRMKYDSNFIRVSTEMQELYVALDQKLKHSIHSILHLDDPLRGKPVFHSDEKDLTISLQPLKTSDSTKPVFGDPASQVLVNQDWNNIPSEFKRFHRSEAQE